jgi:hypothetical protein
MSSPSLPVEVSLKRPAAFLRRSAVNRAGGWLLKGLAGMFFLASGLRAEGELEPRNLVDQMDKTLRIEAPPGAKVEPTPSGGLKVSYTVETPPGKSLWVSVKRVFSPAEPGSAVSVDVSGFEGAVLLNVWNDEKKQAFKRLDAPSGNVVDLHSLHYRGSEEDFSGKVIAVEVAMEVTKQPGDHVVEIERFVLDR